MPKKGEIHYCNVITPGPLLFIRFPWECVRWRKILQALTPVMRSYGLKQKDICGMDGYVRDDYDAGFIDRLDKAYEGDLTIVKSFDLWDWKDGVFVQIRKVKK